MQRAEDYGLRVLFDLGLHLYIMGVTTKEHNMKWFDITYYRQSTKSTIILRETHDCGFDGFKAVSMTRIWPLSWPWIIDVSVVGVVE